MLTELKMLLAYLSGNRVVIYLKAFFVNESKHGNACLSVCISILRVLLVSAIVVRVPLIVIILTRTILSCHLLFCY
jgi:hypothetical protein